MTNTDRSATLISRIAALLDRGDTDGLREALVSMLAGSGGAAGLRALDTAGLLTRIIPELEPARDTDQPIVHFLPVLAHSLEAVTAVEWLLGELQVTGHRSQVAGTKSRERAPTGSTENREFAIEDNSELKTQNSELSLPVAVQTHPGLRYRSAYAEELRAHFASAVGRYPRAALFKLAALLHDIAKPQTRQPKPGGGVSFHDHQTIGGQVALVVARRLGFDAKEAGYIRAVVREHMRPGQLAYLDEITLKAVRRFFQATGHTGPDVLLFLLADHLSTRGPLIDVRSWLAQAAWIDALLDTIWGEEPEITPPLVNGDDIIRELGIAPGPLVGRLLAAVGEAQAGGEIATRDEAIALAKRVMRDA